MKNKWLQRSILISIALLLVVGLSTVPVKAVSDLEKRIASQNLKLYVQQYGLANLKEQERARIDQIFADLAKQARRDASDLNFRYYVINAPVINAAYLGDGRTIIFRGLLENIGQNNQLAAILAHELGHGVNNDIAESIKLMQTMQFGSQMIDLMRDGRINQQGPGIATSIAFSLLQKGYSRDQERAADKYSVLLLHRAGYDPQGAVEVMEFLQSKQEGPTDSQLLEIFSTHPNLDSRINYLAQQVNKLETAEELYYSPVATARRFITGLLADNLHGVYAAYDQSIHKEVTFSQFKAQEQIINVQKRVEGLGVDASYELQLRNQVEGTARVAIGLPTIDLTLALDLIQGQYGWKIKRGPFSY